MTNEEAAYYKSRWGNSTPIELPESLEGYKMPIETKVPVKGIRKLRKWITEHIQGKEVQQKYKWEEK